MRNDVTSFYKDASAAIDAGLRKYMLNVFSYMSLGLGISAIVAYLASTSSALMGMLFSSPMMVFVVALVPLGISLYLSTRLAHISSGTASTLFMAYAATLGLSLAPIFIIYSGECIAQAFFVTAAMFLSMVIYGYVTGKDLTKVGSLLLMGLIGLIIASLVNFFLRSSTMMFIISVVGVVIFTGMTAYDTQAIKSIYFEDDSPDVSQKKAIIGALSLYLDFVNLFLCILRLMNVKRD